MSKKKKINKGIIISGGEINAKNITTGKNSKIINADSTSSSKKIKPKENKVSKLKVDLKNKIAEDKLDEVIEKLITHFKNNQNNKALNAVIMQSSALHQLNLQSNLELIGYDNSKQSKAKITHSILEIIDKEMN